MIVFNGEQEVHQIRQLLDISPEEALHLIEYEVGSVKELGSYIRFWEARLKDAERRLDEERDAYDNWKEASRR